MSDPRKIKEIKEQDKVFKEVKEREKSLKEKELVKEFKDKDKDKDKETKEGLKDIKEKEIKEIKEFKERKEKEVKEFKEIKEQKEFKEFKEFEGPIEIEQPVLQEAALAGAEAPADLRKTLEKIKPEKELEKIKPEKEFKEIEKIKPEKELEKIKPEKEKGEKEIFEGPGDLTVEERLTRIESAITQIAHFIQADLRPDLGQSALRSEPDAGEKPTGGTEGGGGGKTRSGRKRG